MPGLHGAGNDKEWLHYCMGNEQDRDQQVGVSTQVQDCLGITLNTWPHYLTRVNMIICYWVVSGTGAGAHGVGGVADLGAAEEDAVSPGRHAALLAAVVVERLHLVELVGRPERDGRLLQRRKRAPGRHLIAQLVLHAAQRRQIKLHVSDILEL